MKGKSRKPEKETLSESAGLDKSHPQELVTAEVHFMSKTYEVEFPRSMSVFDLKEALREKLELGYGWDFGIRTDKKTLEPKEHEIVADYADESGKLTLYLMPRVAAG
jgi:hypothetical protein